MNDIRAHVTAGLLMVLGALLIEPTTYPTAEVQDGAVFDFIVVGAGSAGCAAAARLSEVASWDVLLLEAGGQPPSASDVPSLSSYHKSSLSPYNYNYRSTRQKYSRFAFRENREFIDQGKVIGGTSALNFMLYHRGHKKNFEDWVSLGNPGWDYETVLKYYIKAEDFRGNLSSESIPYHGKGGPLAVERQSTLSLLARYFKSAGQELGFSEIDPNGGKIIGYYSPPYFTKKNGVRQSSAKAYLMPIGDRQNLKLRPNTQATKILFNSHKRAIGVQYNHNGKTKRAYVRREVIVSAGALNSPKLLMLSGLGPKEHLDAVGAETVVNLPGVGQNLQDHYNIRGLNWLREREHSSVGLREAIQTTQQYKNNRTGMLSDPFGIAGHLWVNLNPDESPDVPNIQFEVSEAPLWVAGGNFAASLKMKSSVYNDYFRPYEGQEGFSIVLNLMRPKSKGSVTLKSSNPLDDPIIDPNYFEDSNDANQLLKAVRYALQIGNTKAFREGVNATFINRPLLGCQHLSYGSDAYWRCFIRSMPTTAAHFCCTAGMGPSSNKMSVVSNRLEVHGVAGLRVADMSITPTIPSTPTNAVAMMIGERAADFIKEDYGQI